MPFGKIRYDFDLGGLTIVIPQGVLIKFRGGSISNGALNGNDTQISASIYKIFGEDLIVTGLMVEEVYPEWFGAMKDGVSDDSIAIQKAFYSGAAIVKFEEGVYASSDVTYQNPNGVAFEKGLVLRGLGKKRTFIKNISSNAFLTIDGSVGMTYNPSDKPNYIYDFKIENLSIQSDKITSHDAVKITATWGFICKNVTIENHKGTAILGKLNPNISDPDKSAMVSSKIENCDFFYNDYGIKANNIFSIENLDIIKSNIQWNAFCGIYGVITYLNINSGSIAFNGTGLSIGTEGPLAESILYGGVNIPISTFDAIPRNIRIIGCEIDSNWPQNIYIKCSYNAVIKQNAFASRLFPQTNFISKYSIILGDSSGTIKNFNSEISSNLMRIPPSGSEFPEQNITFVLSDVTDIGSILNEQVYAINDGEAGEDYFFVEAKNKSGIDDTYFNQIKVVTQRGVGLMSDAYKLTWFKEFYVRIDNGVVKSFRPPELYGILAITRGYGTNNSSALIAYDLGANALNQLGSSSVNTNIALFTSTILTGSNGTSGKINISEDSGSGKIYISNEIGGGPVFVYVTLLNTSNAES